MANSLLWASDLKVAMLAAESNASWRNDVKDKLLGTGLISEVDVINVNATTPTLATLQQYAAVMIWSDSSFDNRTEMGNVLADYVDQGGGVVQATFSFYSDGFSLGLGGRWVTDAGYRTLTQANQSQGTVLTLVADEPAHAILSGVNSFNGGSNSYHNASSLTSGSTLIAHWSNNRPLVAVRTGPSAGKIVGLNMFPPSSDERADLWDASTDGALLMANSLSWVAGVAVSDQPPTLTVTDRSVDEGATVNSVDVASATDPEGGSLNLTSGALPAFVGSFVDNGDGTGSLADISPGFSDSGSYPISVTAEDSAGSTATETFDLTVVDVNRDPVAVAVAFDVVECTGPSGASVTLYSAGSTDPDGDTLTISWSGPFGTSSDAQPTVTLPVGEHTIILTVGDGRGGTDTDTIIVEIVDTTPPVLTIPGDVAEQLTDLAGTPVSLAAATATDICDSDVTITTEVNGVAAPIPATFPLGVTTIRYIATDDSGNVASNTTTVTVQDTIAPVLTIPGGVAEQLTDLAGTPVSLAAATATDINNVTITTEVNGVASPVPATFLLGITTIRYIATDDSGNVASDTTTVTVQDTTAPVLTIPGDVVEQLTDLAGTPVSLAAATATDINNVTITTELNGVDAPIPATFPLGITTIRYIATDDSDNVASDTMTVTVEDTTAPSVTAPADITAFEATAPLSPIDLGTATASDLVDGSISPTASNLGPFTVGTHTITWTATDNAGNTGSAIQLVTVVDTTPPVVTAPANIIDFEATAPLTPVDPGTGTASDLVDGNISPGASTLGPFAVGTHTVTWTATDSAGNTGFAIQLVTIIDSNPPEAKNQFNPETKTVDVLPLDDGSGVADMTVACGPTSWGGGSAQSSGKNSEKIGKAELCTYVITDNGGNATTLVEKRMTGGSGGSTKSDQGGGGGNIQIVVVSVQYGNDAPILFPQKADKKFEWSLNNDGTLKELEQKMEVGTAQTKQQVTAHYSSKKGETEFTIHGTKGKWIDDGLALIGMVTSNGELLVDYPGDLHLKGGGSE